MLVYKRGKQNPKRNMQTIFLKISKIKLEIDKFKADGEEEEIANLKDKMRSSFGV
jgi:hypothetical protein